MAIVSQKRAYGEEAIDQKVVEKNTEKLDPKFDYVVPSIEVAYDLSQLTQVKLMGSLQSQEERLLGDTDDEKSDMRTMKRLYKPGRMKEETLMKGAQMVHGVEAVVCTKAEAMEGQE